MQYLIIGGGLCGLALADALDRAGRDYTLIEARDRLGGRMMTEHHAGAGYDMGPAWFWPGQPRISALVDRLGLTRFDQYASGAQLFEDAQGHVQQGRGFASMQGSWRLDGGFGALTQRLSAGLDKTRLHLQAQVTTLTRQENGITVTLRDDRTFTAEQVILTLPPRIAAGLTFAPALPDALQKHLSGTPTWMAGHAKALAVYETPFWRKAGLSGDASSRHGPMVELHDASPRTGGPYALFGFIGVPPQGRTDIPLLRQHVLAQLTRLYGPDAATPMALHIKDWAFDPCTATQADHAPLTTHPAYGPLPPLPESWAGALHIAGTEAAAQFGGYLEGALEAAEHTRAALAL